MQAPASNGKKFKTFLERKGFSVAFAAEKLGQSRSTVYTYFKSKNLTDIVVSNITKQFGVSVDEVWGETQSAPAAELSENAKLKILRKAVGENQKVFAESLGIIQSHLSNIENGHDGVSTNVKLAIRERFGISLESYIGGVPVRGLLTDVIHEGEVLKKWIKVQSINITELSEKMGLSRPSIYRVLELPQVPDVFKDRLREVGHDPWKELGTVTAKSKVPVWSGVATIGNTSDGELVEPGDWFPDATDYVRHHGHSMVEYPDGSILAIKELPDGARGIVSGEDYIIQYGDGGNRVTKRVVLKYGRYWGYSTNNETYPDGSLQHPPFELSDIHNVWWIIGMIKRKGVTGQ